MAWLARTGTRLIVKVSLSLWLSGEAPLSVTVSVTVNTAPSVPPCPASGIHVKTPVTASKVALAGAPDMLKVRVCEGISTSVAKAVKVSGVNSSVCCAPIGARTGGSLTGFTVTVSVARSKPPRPSATITTKLSVPYQSGAGA